jgi:hypothetical protein
MTGVRPPLARFSRAGESASSIRSEAGAAGVAPGAAGEEDAPARSGARRQGGRVDREGEDEGRGRGRAPEPRRQRRAPPLAFGAAEDPRARP